MAWHSQAELLAEETRGTLLHISRQTEAEPGARWLKATAGETLLHQKLPGFRPLPFAADAWDTVLLDEVLGETPDPYPLLLEARRVAKSRVLISQQLAGGVTLSRLRQWGARLAPRFAGGEFSFDGRPTGVLVIPREKADQENFPRRRDYLPLRFALKIGVPDRTEGAFWGDVHYGEGFQRALQAAGYDCALQYLSEWEQTPEAFDIVVHIKGLSRYRPKPEHINLMWMINHPDLHEEAELNSYDGLMVASRPYADLLASRLTRPVVFAPQAVDAAWFAKAAGEEVAGPGFEVIFIGNNHARGVGEMRPGLQALLDAWQADGGRWRVGVWGKFWEGRLPEGWLQAEAVPPEQAGRLYRTAKIVLNDHHPDMKAQGFLNERAFVIGACGGFQICDHVKGIEAEPIVYYDRAEDLGRLINHYLDHPEERAAQVQALQESIKQHYTFTQSREILLALLADLPSWPRPEGARAEEAQEVARLRALCEEQWTALQKIRASGAYRFFRALKRLAGKDPAKK